MLLIRSDLHVSHIIFLQYQLIISFLFCVLLLWYQQSFIITSLCKYLWNQVAEKKCYKQNHMYTSLYIYLYNYL